MGRTIGVLVTRYIWVGVVEGNELGAIRMYHEPGQEHVDLKSLPWEEMLGRIRALIAEVRQGQPVDSVGAGFPGIVRCGVIDESPNLGQLKGLPIREALAAALKADGLDVPVTVMNDADALAAGLAAKNHGTEQ